MKVDSERASNEGRNSDMLLDNDVTRMRDNA